MIEDRYAVNHTLYIIGMISLLGCILLLMFSLYILPHLLLDLVYDVPDFVLSWQVYLTEEKEWSQSLANWMILLSFIIPSFILGIISYVISNKLDEGVPHLLEKENPSLTPIDNSVSYQTWKLLLILFSLTGLAILIVWSI